MKLPVDDATLASWSALLGLTDEQTAATLADIEQTLRVGYDNRPDELRDATFEQLVGDMDADEAALMFLISGLRQAGHPEAAYAVEIRGIFATLRDLQQTS
ncbi:hypothetical protein [Streptomyces sp. CB03238]|uniref:hypothetical protein n=1 Tax=Streptomyces sp. CB03238 TaxID=1907777 RepID=UPI000A1182A5|nr:hypothetical protein [Streptomyces sp. CB03238]ORT54280.1 hypothetical protein BKD26_35775 [Streptomyces sp. CB03238]